MSNRDLATYVESGKFFKAVVEDGSDIIFIVDYEGNILYHNPAVEENLGYSPKSLTGKNFFDFIHKESREEFEIKFRKSTKKAFDENIEFHFLCRDGNYRYLEFNSINIYHKEKIHGLILDCRDITQLKKNAEELLRAQKAKEQFLANMSHEIRTPINGISGMASLMAEARDESERLSYLEAIRKSSESLKVIINDILDLSIIESGKLRFEKINFNIKEHMNTLYNTFVHQARDKGLQLLVDISPEADRAVVGDPVRLNQILINLISNALKFTHEGEVRVQVSLVEESKNQLKLRFEVSDTGIGIPEEKLNNIFESFTQADESVTRRYGGTGLGLTITRQLIDLLNGSIEVNSEEGKGTKFTCIIPYELGKDNEVEGSAHRSQSQMGEFEDLRVLIVEDNEINRLYATKLLEKWNVITDEAENGVLAIEKLENADFDIVLMDLQMPVMDGFETATIIRSKLAPPKNKVPIIAFTANVVKRDSERCFEVGMNDYITKPFKPEELYSLLHKYGNGKKSIKPSPAKVSRNPTTDRVTDLTYLNQVCSGDPVFIREMIDVFQNTIPTSLEKMEILMSTENWTELAKAIHKVKPSYTFMGLNEQVEQIKRIESIVDNNGNTGEIPELFKSIRAVSLKALEELRTEERK